MKFETEILRDLTWGDGPEEYELIDNVFKYKSRWLDHYDMIFKFDDKFWRAEYSRGATECQDQTPFEYEDDEVECEQVFPVEVKQIVYRSEKEINKLG